MTSASATQRLLTIADKALMPKAIASGFMRSNTAAIAMFLSDLPPAFAEMDGRQVWT